MRKYRDENIISAAVVKKGMQMTLNQAFDDLKHLRSTGDINGDVEIVVRAKPHKDDQRKVIIEYIIEDLDGLELPGMRDNED